MACSLNAQPRFSKMKIQLILASLTLGQRTRPAPDPETTTIVAPTTTAPPVITTTRIRTTINEPEQSTAAPPVTEASKTPTETTATRPNSSSSAVPQKSGGSNNAVIIGLVVGGGAVLLAIIGIVLFRKLSLAPSHNFKNRLHGDSDYQLHRKPSPFAKQLPVAPQQYAVYEEEKVIQIPQPQQQLYHEEYYYPEQTQPEGPKYY